MLGLTLPTFKTCDPFIFIMFNTNFGSLTCLHLWLLMKHKWCLTSFVWKQHVDPEVQNDVVFILLGVNQFLIQGGIHMGDCLPMFVEWTACWNHLSGMTLMMHHYERNVLSNQCIRTFTSFTGQSAAVYDQILWLYHPSYVLLLLVSLSSMRCKNIMNWPFFPPVC